MATSQTSITVSAPWADTVTPYDEAHLDVYLRLLDALKDGASNDAMCRTILNVKDDINTARATEILESHIKRAQWMCEMGYKGLLSGQ